MTKREWQIEMANRFAKRNNDIEELDTRSYLIGRYDSTNTLTDAQNTIRQLAEKLECYKRLVDSINMASNPMGVKGREALKNVREMKTIMTKDEALKLALEALEEAWYHVGTFQPTEKAIDLYDKAKTAIKETLAQPEPFKPDWDTQAVLVEDAIQRMTKELKESSEKIKKLEKVIEDFEIEREQVQYKYGPVAWMDDYNACKCSDNETRCFSDRVFRMMQKYTAPPQRTWVGLSEEDKVLIKHDANFNQFMTAGEYADRVQQLTEARLKDKNT